MGGKNVIMVLDDADIDLAIEGALWGAFGTAGQRCTASSRIVVHKKVYKQFAKKLVERARGADPGTIWRGEVAPRLRSHPMWTVRTGPAGHSGRR